MKHSEDNDPVWDLLKNAHKTEPAGNFTQNVMREVRQLDQAPARRSGAWFSFRWAAACTAVAAIALGGFMLLSQPNDAPDLPGETAAATPAPASPSYEEEITIEEFAEELEELAYLSDLMEVPDTSLLADEDLAALLF